MSSFTPTGGNNVAGTIGISLLVPTSIPTIVTPTIALANTEQSYALPLGTTRIAVKCRGSVALKFSWTSGQSGTVYETVPVDTEYTELYLSADCSLTFYYQSPTAGAVVEIQTWT